LNLAVGSVHQFHSRLLADPLTSAYVSPKTVSLEKLREIAMKISPAARTVGLRQAAVSKGIHQQLKLLLDRPRQIIAIGC